MSIEPGIGMPMPQQGAVPGSVVYRPVPSAVSAQIQNTGKNLGIKEETYNQEYATIGGSSQREVYGYDIDGKIVKQDPSIVKNQFPLFSNALQKNIVNAIRAMGGKPTQASIETFLGNVLDYSVTRNEMTGQATAWPDAINEFIMAYQQVQPRGGGGGGGGGPTQAVTLTDPGTAKQLINQSLQQYLGRNATPDELQNFVAALNKAEMKSPRVSRVAGATAVTAGGFNPATFAEDYAAGMEGAGEFQAVTSALDNFIGSLANPVKVV